MRKLSIVLATLAGLVLSVSLFAAGNDQSRAVGSMQELMTRIIQPTSDAVFYISRTPPQSDADWLVMERQTLMLAESANLLLIPGYREDGERWLVDVEKMRVAAEAALQAARDRDMDTLIDLNNDLYMSCESCHEAIR